MGVAGKDAGVGCGMRRSLRQMTAMPEHARLGMPLAKTSEMRLFATESAAGCARSLPPKQQFCPQASTCLVPEMIELHQYPMKNYEMICKLPWRQHLAPRVSSNR